MAAPGSRSGQPPGLGAEILIPALQCLGLVPGPQLLGAHTARGRGGSGFCLDFSLRGSQWSLQCLGLEQLPRGLQWS